MAAIVAVRFGSSERTYDYQAGDFSVAVGQRVWVPTRAGKGKATVVEVKEDSDVADKAILGIVEEEKSE